MRVSPSRREIPSEIIAEARRIDMAQLAGRDVHLTRDKSRWIGLCPFHADKTPSLVVFTQTNSFHCFGCSADGDPIRWVMAMQRLSFPRAVAFLMADQGAHQKCTTATGSVRDEKAGPEEISFVDLGSSG